MKTENIQDIYELTPLQHGILFHSLYAPETAVYFIQLCYSLRGNFNTIAFERAWQEVLDRHTILRTAFYWEDLEKPLQVVNNNVTIVLQQYDWREKTIEEQKLQLQGFLESDRVKGFDFSQAPLMRLALIRCADDFYYFIWSKHHLILDGWSTAIVLKEVVEIYQAIAQGQEFSLVSRTDYEDYIKWLQKQDLSQTEVFWRQRLSEFKVPNSLNSLQCERLSSQEKKYKSQSIKLSKTTTEALQAFVRSHQLTLNIVIQGAWAILLSHYSDREDVVFGVTVSGRPTDLLGTESMVGMFINTLPIRAKLNSEMSLLSWLVELQKQQLEINQYQYSSLVDIQSWSEIPKGLPLFESIFVFENYPIDDSLKEWQGSLEIQSVSTFENSNYPLTINVIPGSELEIAIAYDCNRFESATINRVLGHFQTLLKQMSECSEVRLKELTFLTAAEQHQLLKEWNDTKIEYPQDKCVHQLFEEQVKETPDAIAIVFEEQQLTYKELNDRANQLAHYLQTLGVKPEVLVGMCLKRSLEMVIGLLGILKAGGAYLPLDPEYPQERLAFVLSDARVSILLTQRALLNTLLLKIKNIVCIDTQWQEISKQSDCDLIKQVNFDNLAYTIYTSGSTGKPKGVQILHRGLVNFLNSMRLTPGLNQEDICLSVTTLSFDIAALEIYLPLIVGARLVLVNREVAIDAIALSKKLDDIRATVMQATPATWRMLLVSGWKSSEQLKILCGGEALNYELAERLIEKSAEVWNLYGPTETTIWSAIYPVSTEKNKHQPNIISIGKALANTQIYLLNSQLQPVPVGVAGELYITGEGIARGYLNRPELTATRFIPNPFSENHGSRLYRTGDLARYLADGKIEYIGRIDCQVKLRGFRIELGEIEAVLSQHEAVATSVVVLREDIPGNPNLVAYAILQPENTATINSLQNYLESKLPGYMVPSAFVILKTFPLTPNGKIDRKALPVPNTNQLIAEGEYLAPLTPTQEILTGIWQEILGVERVGIKDNFFSLGGHSLIATRTISRIRQVFKIELPLRSLFEKPTVADLAAEIETANQGKLGLIPSTIKPVLRDRSLPLSFAQQRLWFIAQLEPDSPFYNQPTTLRLTGELQISLLKQSLEELIKRHEPLRTTFSTTPEGLGVQNINQPREFFLPIINLEKLNPTTQAREIQKLANSEAKRAFNLERDSLLRVTILRLNRLEHIILFTTHHIVSDGWSIGILTKEIATLYEAYLEGKPSPLPELAIQYADFAVWQREWLHGEILSAQLNYWQQQLQDVPVLNLSTDYPRPAIQSHKGATQSLTLSEELSQALKAFSQQQGVTLFMTLLAVFQVLLHRYSNQEDIVVGTPIANRNRAETEGLIGFFVNTLVLRANLERNPSFTELLKRVREVTLEAYTHQDIPFEQLVDELKVERHLNRNPLFDVMFTFENNSTEELKLPGLTLSPCSQETQTALFDMTLSMTETEQGLAGEIEYSTDLFHGSAIARMLNHFQVLLEAIIDNPKLKLSQIPLLTATEQDLLLKEWNDTEVEYPQDKCIHQLFEERVERIPDTVALVFKDQCLTYRELNSRANRLAHYLQKLGVKAEVTVGLYLERSLEMSIAILGVLKAGGAYIPIDPAYPSERITDILEDAQVEIILTQQHLEFELEQHQKRLVKLDSDWSDLTQESSDNCQNQTISENLAYVIYTSGSTGKPKGVAITHQALVNYTLNIAKQLELKQCDSLRGEGADRFLQFASIGFDVVVEEIFPSWITGATVVLLESEGLISCAEFQQFIKKQQLTIFELPTAYWHQWVLELSHSQEIVPSCVRLAIVGGERISRERLRQWQQFKTPLVHVYGLTETTVTSTMYCLNSDAKPLKEGMALPIGRPIANTQIYLLNSHLQPLPVGVVGEIYIGGEGIARGYLNRFELTALRFVPNPFSKNAGSRLYRTGDKAKYLPDGQIEYIGRTDYQVKFRGFRIELGEIDGALSQHQAVATTVAMLREDNPNKSSLVAYATLQPQQIVTASELRHYLESKLPNYMVPNAFVILPELPLTPNGKIDRKALPVPDSSQFVAETEYITPVTRIEEILAGIWQEILGVEKVGVRDNFFELGGDSILSLQIIAKAHQTGLHITPKQIFQHQTIAELVSVVDGHIQNSAEQGIVTGSFPLTPIQTWFFEQNFPVPHHWNQSVLLETRSRIDPFLLEKAVEKLLEHHDILRLCFEKKSSGFQPVIVGERTASVTQIDLSKVSSEQCKTEIVKAANDFQASFNLLTGPLIRFGLFDLGTEQSGRLLIVIHHLVIDELSWRILLEDLQGIYQQLVQKKSLKLPLKTISFKQWANRIQEYSQSQELRTQLDYWLSMLERPVKSLPKDYPGEVNLLADTNTIKVALSIEDTQALLKEVPTVYRSQINDVLLTALVETFAQWTGARSLLFDLEGHGREELFEDIDLSRTVGWFTSIYPVFLNLEQAVEPSLALKTTKEQLRSIPQHGIGYGLLRYLNQEQKVTKLLNSLPRSEICFNYLGQHDQVLAQSPFFKPALESSGNGVNLLNGRSYLFEINSVIAFGSLQIEFSYSKKLYRKFTVEILAEGFIEALKSIIGHCQAVQVGFTPSDFPLINLTQEELESAFNQISY